jgi:hypothetical protein
MRKNIVERKGGVLCHVLRPSDRRPGTRLLSDRHSQFFLIVEGLDPTPTPSEDTPALLFLRERCLGQPWTIYAPPPAAAAFAFGGNPFATETFGFGGNWLWASDPRFPADHPIRIHDMPLPRWGDEIRRQASRSKRGRVDG